MFRLSLLFQLSSLGFSLAFHSFFLSALRGIISQPECLFSLQTIPLSHVIPVNSFTIGFALALDKVFN
jgi:hypothetical protein